jgi:hypothetical protein
MEMLDSFCQLFTWSNLVALMNSNFTAALAGAFAGAIAAQRIANRAKQRDTLLLEMRNTNAAIMVAASICDTGLKLKKQQVKPIYDRYIALRKEHDAFKQRGSNGREPQGAFVVQADLTTVQMPEVPIDVLRTQIYEKISTTGRPLAVAAVLSSAVSTLAGVLRKRIELIERFRAIDEANPLRYALYLAEPYGDGHVSEEFSDTVKAMYWLTDDVIFFSELLQKDLKSHGELVLEQYKTVTKREAKKVKISSVDWALAHNEGLMPSEEEYPRWRTGFPNAA